MTDRDLIRILKALADPTRFRMVQEIAARGELNCGQVAENFDVSQPTISHHIKILVDAGLVLRRTEGKNHITTVNHALISDVVARLAQELSANARPDGVAPRRPRRTPKGTEKT